MVPKVLPMPVDSEELDAAMTEAVLLCKKLTDFDLAERSAGRITLAFARFEAAMTHVKSLLGVDTGGLNVADE